MNVVLIGTASRCGKELDEPRKNLPQHASAKRRLRQVGIHRERSGHDCRMVSNPRKKDVFFHGESALGAFHQFVVGVIPTETPLISTVEPVGSEVMLSSSSASACDCCAG